MPAVKLGKTILDALTPDYVFNLRLEEARKKGKSAEVIAAMIEEGARPQEDLTDLAKKGLSIRASKGPYNVINKQWRFSVYSKKDKKQRVIGFGSYPSIGLAEAHKTADRMRGNAERGRDPEQDTDETEGSKLTIQDLVDGYIAWLVDNNKRTVENIKGTLYKALIADKKNPGVPLYGHLRTIEFTIEVRAKMIATIQKRGAKIVVNRVCQYIKRMCKWGVDYGYQFDPRLFIAKGKINNERKRTRYLSKVEFPKVWNGLPDALAQADTPNMHVIIWLAAIFGCRLGQVCGMRQSEITWEDWLGCYVWTIPAERCKNNHPHALPMPSLAVEILNPVLEAIGKRDVIFKSCHSDLPVQTRVVGAALRRYRADFDVEKWTAHTMRHTFSTQLVAERNDLGVDSLTRSVVMHHRSATHGGVTGVYDHNEHPHLRPQRVALEKWCALIREWVRTDGGDGGNVVPFAPKVAA